LKLEVGDLVKRKLKPPALRQPLRGCFGIVSALYDDANVEVFFSVDRKLICPVVLLEKKS